jgi:hypothetical protein
VRQLQAAVPVLLPSALRPELVEPKKRQRKVLRPR